MEATEIIQNGGLVLSGGLVAKFFDWLISWHKAKTPQKLEQPIETKEAEEYVTVKEFNRHVADNEKEHENLFARLNRNDMITSEINGKLSGIKEDLTLIKNKLFRISK